MVYCTSTQPAFLSGVCRDNFTFSSIIEVKSSWSYTSTTPVCFMACIGTALLPVTWRIWRNSDEGPNACQDSRVTGQIWNWNFPFAKQDLCSPNRVVVFLWYRFNFRPIFLYFSFRDTTSHSGPGPSYCPGFTITLRHTTLGRTPLDEWSVRHRDLYLTTRNTHNTDIQAPGEIRSQIPASERPQTHALDGAAAEIGPISV